MPIYDLYSKRREDAQRGDTVDVYEYDSVPGPLRVQMRKILTEGLGPRYVERGGLQKNPAYQTISNIICREYGLDDLGKQTYVYDALMNFMDRCSTDQFLDIVELGCAMIDTVVREESPAVRQWWQRTQKPDELLEEVNYRFQRAGVGYQYADRKMIRIDSEFIHSQVTKPALSLLRTAGYAGAQEEFLGAHDHFREGRYKEAITEAAKSFESMMKAICDRKGWTYSKGARASDLLKVLRRNHLWPEYLDGSFDQLAATLQSGLPQVRNDRAAHGQGATRQEAPEYVAAYALHLAASKIVLLADAAAAIPDVAVSEEAIETV